MRFIILCLLLLAATLIASADRITGKVIAIADGETITALCAENCQHKTRINWIDAPDIDQDFGQVLKETLLDLLFGNQVTVVWTET